MYYLSSDCSNIIKFSSIKIPFKKFLSKPQKLFISELAVEASSELKAELSELQRYKELSRKNEKYENNRVTAVHKVTLQVINLFNESETVYIIVNRADRCQNWTKFDHCKVLLEGLAKMVKAARCKLRVLIVINRYSCHGSQALWSLVS